MNVETTLCAYWESMYTVYLVRTQRRLDVYTTSRTLGRRPMNVESTLFAYRKSGQTVYLEQCRFIAGLLQLFVHFDFLPWLRVKEDICKPKDRFYVPLDVYQFRQVDLTV